MSNKNAEDAETSSKPEKRTVLVLEIDITNAGSNWVIMLEKSDLFLGPFEQRQIIMKRSSREDVFAIPAASKDNPLLRNVYINTHDT